ncbi:MAG: hypothetical protein ACK4NP_12830 [Parvularculaceae bacterium]
MSKKSGAQAGEGKLESRFAALTSGLLARKGQAAPSNSPVIDPAEETEAFTLSDAIIPRKKDGLPKGKGAGLSPLSIAPRAAPPPVPHPPAPAPQPPVAAKSPSKPAPAPPARVEPPPAQRPAAKPAPAVQPITVINERSLEAGYPDNPSVEELEAMEAEADEVVSYFQNFGGEAAAEARDLFFDDESALHRDPLDDLDEGLDAGPAATALSPAPDPAAPEVRARVGAELGARAFMRLSLGAAELNMAAEDLIAEAIEEYLDARGVDSLGGEEFLKKLAVARQRTDEA